MPTHRIRGLLAEGKAPKPDGLALNGSCLSRSGSRDFATWPGRASSEMSPRNCRVRWTFSGRTQRTSPTTGRARAALISDFLTSGGGKTATKVRTRVLTGLGALLSGFASAAEGSAVDRKSVV